MRKLVTTTSRRVILQRKAQEEGVEFDEAYYIARGINLDEEVLSFLNFLVSLACLTPRPSSFRDRSKTPMPLPFQRKSLAPRHPMIAHSRRLAKLVAAMMTRTFPRLKRLFATLIVLRMSLLFCCCLLSFSAPSDGSGRGDWRTKGLVQTKYRC